VSRARAARRRRCALAGGLAELALAVALVGACVPSAPADQTTAVDVERYQELAADPWIGADDIRVARYRFGSNKLFDDGLASAQRQVTGERTDVLTAEIAAAATVGWWVAGATCDGARAASGGGVSVELVRALADGSSAVATMTVTASDRGPTPMAPAPVAPTPSATSAAAGVGDGATSQIVSVVAEVPHHSHPDPAVPDRVPVDVASLTCLGGSAGGTVGQVGAFERVRDR